MSLREYIGCHRTRRNHNAFSFSRKPNGLAKMLSVLCRLRRFQQLLLFIFFILVIIYIFFNKPYPHMCVLWMRCLTFIIARRQPSWPDLWLSLLSLFFAASVFVIVSTTMQSSRVCWGWSDTFASRWRGSIWGGGGGWLRRWHHSRWMWRQGGWGGCRGHRWWHWHHYFE